MASLENTVRVMTIVGICSGVVFAIWDHARSAKPVVEKSASARTSVGNGNAIGNGSTVYNGPVSTAPVPVITADQEQLLDDAFDMLKRMHVLQTEWADAQLKVRIAGANQSFPMEQMDDKQAAVDAEFAGQYRAHIAPALIAVKSRFLAANPASHSYRSYEQISSFTNLLDIEQDFASLRSEYKRKLSTEVRASNTGSAPP